MIIHNLLEILLRPIGLHNGSMDQIISEPKGEPSPLWGGVRPACAETDYGIGRGGSVNRRLEVQLILLDQGIPFKGKAG